MSQKHLYKYIPFEALSCSELQNERQSAFERGEIWYPKANELNDPFDCSPNFKHFDFSDKGKERLLNSLAEDELNFIGISKEELLSEFKKANISKNKISIGMGILHGIFSFHLSKLGVLSLTEKHLELLMWVHYADNAKGICLEFECNLGDEKIRKVDYVEKRPLINFYDRHNEIENIIYTKSIKWEYEDEWRDVKKEGNKTYPFPGKLRRIFFGPACHLKTMELTKDIFGNEIKYENISLSNNYSLKGDNGLKHSISQTPIVWK
ncbi:MAG: DUF2971 domain-containing protein [Nitrospinae bacterium]|nr:DUF2971 domain-containing protein [Nitrospinota bacterium]